MARDVLDALPESEKSSQSSLSSTEFAYDFLDDGVRRTLDALDLGGVLRLGAGRNLVEASAPLYAARLGVPIVFIAPTVIT